MTLELTEKKTLPVIVSTVLSFVFKKLYNACKNAGFPELRSEPAPVANARFADFTVLRKTKALFGKDATGKKLCFCKRYFWKMKEKPANKDRGLCFATKSKITRKNSAHFEDYKNTA